MTPSVEARSPGRVNLIGEHTDYNDGFVLPAAIGYYTTVAAVRRTDETVSLRSAGFGEAAFDARLLPKAPRHEWSDYAAGVLLELTKAGVALPGANLTIESTLPAGSGLSSSASFEVAVAMAVAALAGNTFEPIDLARLCQRAENEFVGARTGVMDQMAVLVGRAGFATFLDTRSMHYEYAPVPRTARVVVADTKTRHALAGGEYNERRAECEAAVAAIARTHSAVRALRDVSLAELNASESAMPAVTFRRARHVVTENARTVAMAAALRAGNLDEAGALMNASHESLRDDYEVSSIELDALVDAARAAPGAYGARMTGGGFGGCTVNLVDAERTDAFRDAVARRYRAVTGIEPAFYDGTPVDGAAVE